MGRKLNPYKPRRLPLTLIEQAHKRLERLVHTGGYGNNTTEAVKIIVMAHLHALADRGKIDLFDDPEEAKDSNKK